jgi:ribosome-binding protein aMBF1 (putative translation factor)
MAENDFVIGYTGGYFNHSCGLCGGHMESGMPLGVFLKGCHRHVCDSCADRETHNLHRIVQMVNADFDARVVRSGTEEGVETC